MSLAGRAAVVTGGGSGLGLAIAHALAACGASVRIASRRLDLCQEAAAALPVIPGMQQTHSASSCNVCDPDSCRTIFADLPSATTTPVTASTKSSPAVSESGPILVNAAGVSADGLLARARPDDMARLVNVNLLGAMHASQAALRSMLRERSGVIINIGSVVGIKGSAGQCAYAASKAGLEGLTRSLAREVGSRGVRVNLVAPGFVPTDMTSHLDESRVSALIADTPLGRFGTKEDVAGAVIYLATANYVTGTTLVVDGGMTA